MGIRRVTHQRRDAGQNAFGERVDTFTDVVTIGTRSVLQIAASEVTSDNRQAASQTIQVDLPYSMVVLAMRDVDRLVIDTVAYQIKTIDSLSFARRFIRLTAEVVG